MFYSNYSARATIYPELRTVIVQMCFILVHVGLRSVLVLLEKAYMGEDGVQLNSYLSL